MERPILGPPILAVLNGYKLLASHGSWESSIIPESDTAGTFCTECSELFQRFNDPFGVSDLREISILEEAAKNGCPSCSMFQSHLSLVTEELLDHFKGKLLIWLTMVPNLRNPFVVGQVAGTPFKFVAYEEKEVLKLLHRGYADTSTASESSFSLARQWILQCWTNHTSCRPAQDYMPYRPTRLLDVSGTSGTIRLREKNEIPHDAVYVTLSHCWGVHVPHKLTTQNIESMKNQIALESLGKSFQDAVEIARQLAVQYIWIDCLCIIQDCTEDMIRELAVMQHVYGNTFCNIAATDSRDSRGGCFRKRNPNAIQPVRFDIRAEDSEGNSNSRSFYLTDIDVWWERFENSPLHQRAWVFQERLLSPRVLHFDQDQLVWECNELTACERFPWGMGGLIKGPRMRLPLEEIFRKALASGVEGSEIHDIWRPMVRTYSSAKLRYDSDRLAAIHGVAMRIKDVFGAQYAAGLFSRNMNNQLLWHVIDNETSCRPTEPVAPSWSWASIRGAVNLLPQWDSVDFDDIGTINQPRAKDLREIHYCEILNKDTLGLTSSSPKESHDVLELRCLIIPCFYVTSSETQSWKQCKYKLNSNKTMSADKPNYKIGFFTEEADWPLALISRSSSPDSTTIEHTIYEGSIGSDVLISSIQGDEDSAFYIRFHYDVVSDFRTARKRWLVPVYSTTDWYSTGFSAEQIREVKGLVLEQCGEGEARFRRLGVFEIDEEVGDEKRFWECCYAFEGPETWQRVPVEPTRQAENKVELLQAMQYRIFVE